MSVFDALNQYDTDLNDQYELKKDSAATSCWLTFCLRCNATAWAMLQVDFPSQLFSLDLSVNFGQH